ncbi:carbohydrate-binding family 9-like protein [Larkinella rosea]|uniref:Polyhydroxyalkanoate depolymerase n=1 Tax=Larkinella rosea TaxID=2025312 RepID=A0A3P1BFA2_9BACT|nr:carbohydrate-binding family 9-like protein [Larkinella rosea]RRA99747.1 polyhydroxyalkanoate depolymerase [Larkinella rosea]
MKKNYSAGLPSFLISILGLFFFQGSVLQLPFRATDQTTADTTGWAFPCNKNTIERYTAYRTPKPPVIDGKLDEEIWAKIPRSPRFVDLVSAEPTIHDTRAAVCWDADNLYIAFWVEEPQITGKLTKQNDPIYTDNDVEVFIAGKDTYYEFEINALGTRYEVFFVWQEAYENGGFSADPIFALTNPNVRKFNGVGFKKHPRGLRIGSWDFRFPGLQSAVSIDGTLNDNRDRDRRWTVELAFPWKGMDWLAKADHRALPPKNNDQWRIDFSRFNTYKEAAPATDHGGWAWNAHRVWDSHVPECFPIITFSGKTL